MQTFCRSSITQIKTISPVLWSSFSTRINLQTYINKVKGQLPYRQIDSISYSFTHLLVDL